MIAAASDSPALQFPTPMVGHRRGVVVVVAVVVVVVAVADDIFGVWGR